MSKYLPKPWEAQWAKTLDLSKQIVANQASLANMEMELTLPQTLGKPTIRSVFKGNNGSLGFSVVRVLVTRFIHAFAFSTKLNDAQLETLTVDTLENFAYESLEDIILFFKMARSGKFGATKRGVDANLIFGEWFPIYLDQKAQLREQQHQQQKAPKNTTTMADVAKTYQQIQDRNFMKWVHIYVDRITLDMDRQMLEDTITDWQRDPARKEYVHILKRKRRSVD
ncbi:hypothetical protein NBRC110019_20340 [Neptunitalea chrysea]|uniref:Uncharacterized protein n=1 Tax=Neptunitalea chrysea TaxID=1647581 RepID=A0A9W6B809_9FLAO|nr:hypothetical protein [Neptunitalea chrysea]GLB52994.1 hypothetical protein NBRC110019_20340 [Neptunitalea chrysea]